MVANSQQRIDRLENEVADLRRLLDRFLIVDPDPIYLRPFTPGRAATRAGLTEAHIRKLAARGVFKAVRIGDRRWEIDRQDFDRWLAEGSPRERCEKAR